VKTKFKNYEKTETSRKKSKLNNPVNCNISIFVFGLILLIEFLSFL